MRPHGPRSSKRATLPRLQRRFPAALAASQLTTHMLQRAWTSGSSRSCSAIRACDPRRSRPPDRAAADHSARCCARPPTASSRKKARPWLIPAFARQRRPSSRRTSSAGSVPDTLLDTASRMMPSQKKALRTSPPAARQGWGDGSSAATTAATRSGTTTAAETGHAPNATEPRPGSGSKSVKPAVAVPLVSRRRDRCLADSHDVPSQPEAPVRHADASLGRRGQGSLCRETALGQCPASVRAPHLERPVGITAMSTC